MTTTVHLAPVGAGKTEFALRQLLDFVHHPHQPFLKTWVLLATRRQEVGFRQRLVDLQNAQLPVFFNVEFFNFYELNSRLLNIAGQPPRKVQNSAQIGILRLIINQMMQWGELTFFHEIAYAPGFVSVLADLVDELKQNSVRPEEFASGAKTEKDIEISRIYTRYQDMLIENNLVDLEGEGWLALETLREEPQIVQDVDLLLVDGYDQFTPVQAQLLAELSRTIPQVDITLTTVPERGADYARRFARAFERLQESHHSAGVDFEQTLLNRVEIYRHPDLDELGRMIFQGRAPHPTSDAIRLIEMPTPVEEVSAVLRSVKQQLQDGVRPDDILIALRDWTRYESYFESFQRLYNIPLLLHHRPAYHKTPVIAVLIDLLELAPQFRRRDVLDVLRSPYISAGFKSEQLDMLDRITLEKRLVRGSIRDWLEVIELASSPAFDEDAIEQEPLITQVQADDLSILVESFLEGVTPPAYTEIESFVDWLERLIGQDPNQDPDSPDELDVWYAEDSVYCLHIARQIYEGDSSTEDIIRRDISALNGLKQILRHLMATDLFLRSTLQQTTTTTWDMFWSDLKIALENSADTPGNPSRTGRVLVTTASDARGLPHQHVYILGMAEGVFPAEVAEDPLYLDSERERLQLDSILLETQAERIDDQGLFYELISLPRRTLTLSRPTIQEGKIWIESHLWRAVRAVFPDIVPESMQGGDVVAPHMAASPDEMMLAIANSLNQPDADQAESALSVQNWALSQPALAENWARIVHGRNVDSHRLSNIAHNAFTGYLTRETLIKEVERLLGVERLWSASQLKDYGVCGFRFFAKRMLRLEQIEEPEDGYDVLQLGLLNHKILEETYKQLQTDGVPIQPDELAYALETLEFYANEWFAKAPATFGFRVDALWENEKTVILNRLKALLTLDFSGNSPLDKFGSPREIYAQEERFGDKDARVRHIRIPLADDLEPIRIRGVIDRIDRVGEQLIVVDYKTGSTKINTSEMIAGRDFQMMTYILALQAILEQTDTDLELAGGMFWHLRSLDASGVFDVTNFVDLEALDDARRHIANNLRAGRKGQFSVHANHLDDGKCVRYCEFSHLCRISLTSQFKEANDV